MPNHSPKKLQATLWSNNTNNLDIQNDKNYIIHQVLSIGNVEGWKWLFKAYKLKTLQDVFINNPAKIYRPDAFNFIKKILLSLKDRKLNKEKYVINIPVRTIRSKSDLIFQKLDDIKKSMEQDSINK